MADPKGKKKFLWWAYPTTLELVQSHYRKDNCKSQSEFIERAVNYYVGHIDADDSTSYLPNAFLSNLRSIVAESDNRQGRMMFKFSVEMAMVMNILAAYHDIDRATLSKLRDECMTEVKRLNGNFTFKDALDWQQGT